MFPRRPGRLYVVANFVQTLDGVVSFTVRGRSGGGEISGFDAADRFVMGLLRSCADAVMVASGTLHADSGHVRTASAIYPEARELYAALRSQVAGRRTDPLRPGLAEGAAFLPETAPWFDLQSAKRAGSHLFLRLSARP